jgi:hypothetical protein
MHLMYTVQHNVPFNIHIFLEKLLKLNELKTKLQITFWISKVEVIFDIYGLLHLCNILIKLFHSALLRINNRMYGILPG